MCLYCKYVYNGIRSCFHSEPQRYPRNIQRDLETIKIRTEEESDPRQLVVIACRLDFLWGFLNGGSQNRGLFQYEHGLTWMIWGYPHFRKPPYLFLLLTKPILEIESQIILSVEWRQKLPSPPLANKQQNHSREPKSSLL